jgi:hypothetical protein
LYFRDLKSLESVVGELEKLPRSQVTEDILRSRLQACKDGLQKSLPNSQKTLDQQAQVGAEAATTPSLNDNLRQSKKHIP